MARVKTKSWSLSNDKSNSVIDRIGSDRIGSDLIGSCFFFFSFFFSSFFLFLPYLLFLLSSPPLLLSLPIFPFLDLSSIDFLVLVMALSQIECDNLASTMIAAGRKWGWMSKETSAVAVLLEESPCRVEFPSSSLTPTSLQTMQL